MIDKPIISIVGGVIFAEATITPHGQNRYISINHLSLVKNAIWLNLR